LSEKNTLVDVVAHFNPFVVIYYYRCHWQCLRKTYSAYTVEM